MTENIIFVSIYSQPKILWKSKFLPAKFSSQSNRSKISFLNKLFPSQCGFQKGYSAQHCLIVMIKKFKEAFDRGNEFGALLTELSKACDCINHPLLIAKLYSYGVSPLSVNMIFFLFEESYTSNQNQWMLQWEI